MNSLLVLKTFPGNISPFTTSAIVIAGVCALYLALSRSANKLAQVEHLKDVWGQFTSRPIATFRYQTAISRLDRLPIEKSDFFKVLTFFEGLALLEKRGYLSTTGILEVFGPWIFPYYKELSMCSQETGNYDPNRYPNLRVLHHLLEKLKHKKNWIATLPQEMIPFWQVEAASTIDPPDSARETHFSR